MEIIRYETPLLQSNCYLVIEGSHAIMIDAYWDNTLERFLKDLTLSYVILTHEHYDHISGTNKIREKYGCPILTGETNARQIQDPTSNFSRYFNAYYFIHNSQKPSLDISAESFSCTADQTFVQEMLLAWQGPCVFVEGDPRAFARQYLCFA